MSGNLTEETITEEVQRTFDTSLPTRGSVNCSSPWCSTCMISPARCG